MTFCCLHLHPHLHLPCLAYHFANRSKWPAPPVALPGAAAPSATHNTYTYSRPNKTSSSQQLGQSLMMQQQVVVMQQQHQMQRHQAQGQLQRNVVEQLAREVIRQGMHRLTAATSSSSRVK